MTSAAPTRLHPYIERAGGSIHQLSRAERDPATPEPETSEELDVEGPNESAPGHNPEPEDEEQ